MTIRFIKQWNGHSPDEVNSSLGSTEEARLVGLGFASYDLDGANYGTEEFVKAKRNLLTGGIDFVAGGEIVGLQKYANGSAGALDIAVKKAVAGSPLSVTYKDIRGVAFAANPTPGCYEATA